jgi:hypothetical protein
VAPDTVWEIVFLMVILKIPVVYLCWVVWWAIRAEPRPEEGAAVTAVLGGDDGPGGRRRRGRLGTPWRPGPRGGPARTYPRSERVAAAARAKLDR